MNLDQLTFSSEEEKSLSSIIGQELLEVKYDNWSAELLFKGKALLLTPDEIDIPTESNQYGDIVTLRIQIEGKSMLHNEYSELVDCGKVKNVWSLESSVEIEKPRPVEGSELIAGIKVPPSMGWNNNIYNPTSHKKEYLYRATIGIQIETVDGVWFSLYTDTVGFSVLLHKGKELPEPLLGKCEKKEIKNNLT